ncbi:MAG: 23S rRNA (adenine(2503)-C(2))-methyltransferase RlmN [Candidatus Omnitrophota bacterium]
MKDIKDLTLKELEKALADIAEERFHARQVWSWIYKKAAADFGSMSNLSADLRSSLAKEFFVRSISLSDKLISIDGTQKLLFKLKDGNFIETVIIPAEKRVTGCLSTQAGCKFACGFCASGATGFKRNLTTGEIIEEAVLLKNNSADNKLTHIVFMGTGEPLDNYDNLLKAIRIINSADGLNIGARRITISTCGIIPGIARLAHEGIQVELSVSLHASDDKTRSLLMPVNKIYPLKELLDACRAYVEKTGRQVTFEYILIKGVNSGLQSAQKLITILKGFNCKVNLILSNPAAGFRGQPPGKLEILMFKDLLLKSGVNATLRKSRGADIAAACGQLRLKYEKG